MSGHGLEDSSFFGGDFLEEWPRKFSWSNIEARE